MVCKILGVFIIAGIYSAVSLFVENMRSIMPDSFWYLILLIWVISIILSLR